MIHIIMAEMRQNQQPLSLTDLSQRLQIDYSVLEGIVTTLVRRGYMVEVQQQESPEGPCECGCESCTQRASDVPVKAYQLVEPVKYSPPHLSLTDGQTCCSCSRDTSSKKQLSESSQKE